MTQDEIMRMAREAGLQPYYDEQVTAIARFAAAIVAATEREKCTGTQEFVTLPREVVEQALDTMTDTALGAKVFGPKVRSSLKALRAALERPQADQPAMTPIAQRKLDSLLAEGYTISGYSIYHEQKHQHGFVTSAGLVGWWKPGGMEYPQPKREPLTDEQIIDIADELQNSVDSLRSNIRPV